MAQGKKSVNKEGDAEQYRVTLKEPIHIGGLTLRPGDRNITLSAKVFEENKDKVATYEAL